MTLDPTRAGPKQWQRARHSYFLSTNRTMNWMQARNYCRKSCMDAISIETAEENAWVTDLINSSKCDCP